MKQEKIQAIIESLKRNYPNNKNARYTIALCEGMTKEEFIKADSA